MRQHTNYCHVLTSTSASEEREYDVMECQEKVGTEFYHVTTPTSASEEREHDVNAIRESARKRDSNLSQKSEIVGSRCGLREIGSTGPKRT